MKRIQYSFKIFCTISVVLLWCVIVSAQTTPESTPKPIKKLGKLPPLSPVKVVFEKVTNKGEPLSQVWFEVKTKRRDGTGEVSQKTDYVLLDGNGYATKLPDAATPNKELTLDGKDLLTLHVTAVATNWTFKQYNTATAEVDLTRYWEKVTVPFSFVSDPISDEKWAWLIPKFEVTGYMEITPRPIKKLGKAKIP